MSVCPSRNKMTCQCLKLPTIHITCGHKCHCDKSANSVSGACRGFYWGFFEAHRVIFNLLMIIFWGGMMHVCAPPLTSPCSPFYNSKLPASKLLFN